MLTGKPEQTLLRGKWGPLVLQIIPGFISPTGWWLSKGQKVSDHHKSLHQNNGLTATFWPQTKLLLGSKNISSWSQSLVSIEFLVTGEKKKKNQFALVCKVWERAEGENIQQWIIVRKWSAGCVWVCDRVKSCCVSWGRRWHDNTDQTGAALLPSPLKPLQPQRGAQYPRAASSIIQKQHYIFPRTHFTRC